MIEFVKFNSNNYSDLHNLSSITYMTNYNWKLKSTVQQSDFLSFVFKLIAFYIEFTTLTKLIEFCVDINI